MKRNMCLVCNSCNLKQIIDLGQHSFADSFIPKDKLYENEPVYPLSVSMCLDCFHIQTDCITNPSLRYNLYDYSYTSSNSSVARSHWEELSILLKNKISLSQEHLVIEAGCNDGYLIRQIKDLCNCNVVGVDPSEFITKLAIEKNKDLNIICDFFNRETAFNICEKYGKAKLIIANNVFNHTNSPQNFVMAVSESLDDDGWFVFEFPYWLEGIKSGHFDQIYHEHVSYFTVSSIRKILGDFGMSMQSVEVVDYHGGSLRVFAKKNSIESDDVNKMIEIEKSQNIYSIDFYEKWSSDIEWNKFRFMQKIYDLKMYGRKIVAIGAAAKGNTLLSYYKLDHSVIDYVTDASLAKQGKYTPLTRIPIVSDDILKTYQNGVYVILLSWNISSMLKEKLKLLNDKIEYLDLI